MILSTYNRSAQLVRAVESVLAQSTVDLQLIVVDDGSTDNTQAVLTGLTDPRLRCLRQPNRGLSASRNLGAREAQGEWLLFLDDDDRLLEGGLEALLSPTADTLCRVVLGGVRFVDPGGRILQDRAPESLDHALAGTFLISRVLFHEAGGYLEGLPCSHQTELFLRVRQVLGDRPDAAAFVARPVVEVERRDAAGRPQRSPANAYFGGRWIAARHPDQYTNRRARATLETIAGVNAMRIGRAPDARRRFASAIRLDPMSAGRYLRLGGAIVAPVGRRFWLRQWGSAPAVQRPLDRVRRLADHGVDEGRLPLERDLSPGPDSLFLPWRYRENPSPQGLDGTDSRGAARVDKLAAQIARAKGLEPLIEIGDADDLIEDAAWKDLSRRRPGLVICADLVQRVSDPRRLLSGIRYAMSNGGMALISTPDRSRLRPEAAMGPPGDPRNIREWSAEEFSLLLESCGFEVVRVIRRLPGAHTGYLVRAA